MLLRLLYIAGLRISEASGLRWRHVTPRDGGEAQLTLSSARAARRARFLIPATMAERLFGLKLRTGRARRPGVPSRASRGAASAMGPRDDLGHGQEGGSTRRSCPAR